MTDRTVPPPPHVEGPDADGFRRYFYEGEDYNRTYGGVSARGEGGAFSRVRIATGPERANNAGALHGGFLLSFLDHALFVGPIAAGHLAHGSSVTLAVSTQFVGAGRVGPPLDCVVEVVSETGRLLFLRGQLEQEEQPVLSYQATLRKFTAPKA